jgi:protein gp37
MGGINSENWKLVSRLKVELLNLIPKYPELDFLLLTKRPQNVLDTVHRADQNNVFCHTWYQHGWPDNLWIGTSIEDQKTAEERIPHLLNIPAKVRFLSCEPLLGPVDLLRIKDDELGASWHALKFGIDWVIAGGESDVNARPMHPNWVRGLRDQCQEAGVPFFFKQWGEWHPRLRNGVWPDGRGEGFATCDHLDSYWLAEEGYHVDGFLSGTNACNMKKVGKKAAGRMLDGRTWDEFPKVNQ